MGVIGKPHGVRGAVRVHAYTEDPMTLAQFPLQDQAGRRIDLDWIGEGIARIALHERDGARGITDRDAAARLTNTKLFTERGALPPTDDEEFYLADLVGLAAIGEDGSPMGTIAAVHDFGAGASLELDTGLLLPFTRAAVPTIDLVRRQAVLIPPVEVEAEP